ncbi:MAG: hypothetical protein H7X77_00925, partial [Anaerolineae bacterium]|nr:hypothetical protein [Anaerolineae bacterium]
MTGVDVKPNQDEFAILRDVLHIIATSPSPTQCIDPLLKSCSLTTSASGVAYLLFNEPYSLITYGLEVSELPDENSLKSLALELPAGIHLNPTVPGDQQPTDAAWLMAQVRVNRQIVGVLWLVFEQAITEAPATLDIL